MKDLSHGERLKLSWAPADAEKSIDAVFDYVVKLTEESIAWYVGAKNTKRFFARAIRLLAITLGALAALLPTLGELYSSQGKSAIPAGWTAVMAGVVALLLLIDKFFGFSTAWMRYITSELQLRQMLQEFQIEW